MPRTITHHLDQRNSSGFASHMSTVNGNPSPLREVRSLRSSDSMPELNLGASEKTTYTTDLHVDHRAKSSSKQPSIYSKPSRLAESISMADLEDAHITSNPQALNPKSKSEGRMRAMSWHAKQHHEPTPFRPEPLPDAPMRDSQTGWQCRTDMVGHTRKRKAAPNELFDKLPLEVLTMVMGHLKNLHLQRSNSCATCWLRDCCSITLCNRKLLKASRDVQYEDIQLIGPDSAQQRKKYKGVYYTRLVLLRRTLRADPQLAAKVRFLKVPALPDDAPTETGEYHDIVASLVRACPSLERLDGFYPSYNHSESRLFNALTTRTHLKEMTWVIDAAGVEVEAESGHKAKSSKSKNRHSRHQSSASTLSSHKYLPAAFANKFVRHHMNWPQLTHLTIHCLPGAQLNTPNTLLNVVQTYLTSLQSLYLSGIASDAFNDTTLVALPRPLKKLTLSHCHGVTSNGLSTFATTSSAQRLETLTLIHQNLDTLPAVVRLLANLTSLTRFSLVQSTAPTMPDDESIWLMPYLGSRSLRYLHWDVFDSLLKDRKNGTPGTKTDDILARSIAANGFPNLRFLRVPCDPNGIFQALCRPKERVGLPGDRYRNDPVKQTSSSALRSLARDPVGNAKINTTINKPYASTGTLGPYSSSAISLVLPAASESSYDDRPGSSLSNDSGAKALPVRQAGSDLHRARMLAQARLEAARGFPLFEATITDEEGSVIESTGLAGFLGDIKSNIVYTLTPDLGGSDERGGLVGIMDVLSDGGEDLFGKGDEASRSGAGFGTGCVGSACARAQALDAEAAEAAAKGKAKSKSKGKIAKSNKEHTADQEATKVKDGCTGRWNSYNNENFTMDRSLGDRWAHMERGRWRGRVALS